MEYLGGDARYGEIFKNAMKEFNPILMKEILENYMGFEDLNTLVDVGGADGTILNMIVSKYPNIKGINYDLASVIEKSPSYPGMISNFVFPTYPYSFRSSCLFLILFIV